MNGKDLKEKFGARVKHLRRTNGLTQRDLAESSGISPEYMSRIERGLASPSFDTIARIAESLDRSVREIFAFD